MACHPKWYIVEVEIRQPGHTSSDTPTWLSWGAEQKGDRRMWTKEDFQAALEKLLLEHERKGEAYVDVEAGELHRRLGGYPGPSHRMPNCCSVMKGNMQQGDETLNAPPEGTGSSLKIRYRLPRRQTYEAHRDTLIVVSCTRKKIWDEDPSASLYVPARKAYRGRTVTDWIGKCELKPSSCPWVILSAKYGFIEPDHPIGDYDVTFSRPETGPISDESLRGQVLYQRRLLCGEKRSLRSFKYVAVRGSAEYVKKTRLAFADTGASVGRISTDCGDTAETDVGEAPADFAHGQGVAQALLDYRSRQRTGGRFTTDENADRFLRQNPFAFLVAASIDRGALAEAVWAIPFLLKEELGHLDPRLLSSMSEDELERKLRQLSRHARFPRQCARTIISLAGLVMGRFGGEATAVWKGREPLEVVETLKEVWGVGPGIAHMAVRILTDEFGYRPNPASLRGIDVKADRHVIRVFYRTGLSTVMSGEACVEAARQSHPEFPGLLDWPSWEIGRTWCHEHDPDCTTCPLCHVCSKTGILPRQG